MATSESTPAYGPQPNGTVVPSHHRSGAVARMLRMPVATLRVWERRYGLTQPELSPSGQRLYSADDVRRLALIKQLTDLGHAIGSLAPLDMAQLQRVASTHASVLAEAQTGERLTHAHARPAPAWRLAVVGAALGARLKRPALLRRLGRHVKLLGPFDSVAEAAAALQGTSGSPGCELDALLVHEPRVHPDWLADFEAAAPALAALPKALLYGFAADPVCEALATAGTALLREPQPDAVLAQWLLGLSRAAKPQPSAIVQAEPAFEAVPPRRWDDAALADFAGLSSTIACECPRHVAELLVQLSHFEAYSAECAHRSVADAALHDYLRQVAATSRARFEAALEHVALHEGLILPAPCGPDEWAPPARTRRPQAQAPSEPQSASSTPD
jgi:DNA-binding transcriptional MerR regulator